MTTKNEIPEIKPMYWRVKDSENPLQCDIDDAIESYLDDIDPDKSPKTLILCGYFPVEATLKPDQFLEDILEHLDEDYADPEGVPTKPTETMKQAMKVCCDAICAEYKPWLCKEVCRQVVEVQDWINKKRPHWNECL